MKSIVRIFAIILVITATISAFASCKKDENDDPSYADYTVSVVDGIGNPIANVIVKFTNSDGESKTRVTGKDGIAKLTNALVGDYDVLVEQGPSTVEILESSFTMTEENKTLRVVVLDPAKTVEISGVVDEGSYAYSVGASEYSVVGKPSGTSYYVFTALTKGIYKFSFTSSDADMTIGYYGIPMFVQGNHVGDGTYDGKSFEITVQDVNTPYVVGLNFTTATDAVLKIERVADAPFDPQYAASTVIEAKESFKYFTTCTLSRLNMPNGTSYAVTPVSVDNSFIGFNGTYIGTDDGGNTVNITVTDDKITIGQDIYDYYIEHGVPTPLNSSGEKIEGLTFTVSGTYTDLDIANEDLTVTLGNDGYYYTADGKLVHIHISSPSAYYEASIALISGCIDNNIGNNFGGYVYDSEGNFEAKNSYNEMIAEYYRYSDANGLYPLTAELVEAITVHAESVGWWTPTSPNFLFGDVDYAEENAWLFLCCTAE